MTDEPFFRPPPPPPEPEEDNEGDEPKPWHGPASNVLDGFVPIDLILARTRDVVVFVRGLLAYGNGFEFDVEIRSRNWEVSESLGDAFRGFRRRRPSQARDELPPEQFRFGIQFPDGSTATNTDRGHWDLDREPQPPTLWERGGGGGGTHWGQEYWVWPLPPPEPLEFVCEWPVAGIPLTRIEVDGAEIVEASRRAVEVWPPEPRGRYVHTSMGTWFGAGIARAEPADEEEEES